MRTVRAVALAMAMVPAAVEAASAGATLILRADEGFYIQGVSIHERNSKYPQERRTYDVGSGETVTIDLPAEPMDAGYNLVVRQVFVYDLHPYRQNDRALALAKSCIVEGAQACGELRHLANDNPGWSWPSPPRGKGVTGSGPCNGIIQPAGGRIVMQLACAGKTWCDCRVVEGTPTAAGK